MSERKYTLSEVGFSPPDNSKTAGFNWLSQLWEPLIDREAEIGQDQEGGVQMQVRKLGTGDAPMTKFQQADEMDARSIRAFGNDPKSWNPLYLYHAQVFQPSPGLFFQLKRPSWVPSTSPRQLLNSAKVAISQFMSLSLMALVVEVGLDLTLSPSWRAVLPIATPCGRWFLITQGSRSETWPQ